ncbi:conserved hypothetical protein [Ricinus communis]|uniref:Uncharacterized protein n=1 Tax=Ricinus communis TaxID=3988 RepID=B9RQV8_RICCO|nr:conserved hypothetical protein [Ricinus communis]
MDSQVAAAIRIRIGEFNKNMCYFNLINVTGAAGYDGAGGGVSGWLFDLGPASPVPRTTTERLLM